MLMCDSTHDLRPEPLLEGGFWQAHQVGCRGLDDLALAGEPRQHRS
jgi:hypothetical protein